MESKETERKSRKGVWIVAILFLLCLGGAGVWGYLNYFITYQIEVVQSENGIISPQSKMVRKGKNSAFQIAALSGYRIEEVLVDGEVIENFRDESIENYVYEFVDVNLDHIINAKFIQIQHFDISVTQADGGTIYLDSQNVEEFSKVTIGVTPNLGYELEGFYVDNQIVSMDKYEESTGYAEISLNNIRADRSVKATYIAKSEIQKITFVDYKYNYMVDESLCSAQQIIIPALYKGKKVISINGTMFSSDNKIEKVYIPSSVITIQSGYFLSASSLKEIIVSEDNPYFKSIDGILFNKAGTSLLRYPSSKEGSSFVIPDNITEIASSAFWGNLQLTSLTITQQVETIGGDVATLCPKLVHITNLSNVPMSVDSHYSACAGIEYRESTETEFANSFVIDDNGVGLYTIGTVTYLMGEYGTNVNLNLSSYTFKKIYNSAFSYNKELESIMLPSSLTTINSNAFYKSGLESIVFPSSSGLTEIESGAFAYCENLSEFIFPASVNKISAAAFSNCKSLTAVDLSSSNLATLGESAFMECSNLVTCSLPTSLKAISKNVFLKCGRLSEVSYSSLLTSVGNYAFSETALTTITFSNSIRYIGTGAFYACNLLSEILIPSLLDLDILDKAFDDTAWMTNQENWTGDVIYLHTTNSTSTYLIKAKPSITGECVVDSSARVMARCAFYNCDYLTSVTFPSGITKIPLSAFSRCGNLVSVILPTNLMIIDECAFYYCTSIVTMVIPASVTNINFLAFSHCSALTSLTIKANSLPDFGISVFTYSNLSRIYVPTTFSGLVGDRLVSGKLVKLIKQ